jgi:hypothetical protein
MGLFEGLYPISLTQALAAEEGSELWETSGAHAFYAALVGIVERIAEKGTAPVRSARSVAPVPAEPEPARPKALELAEPPAPPVAPRASVHALPVAPVEEPEEEISADEPEEAPVDAADANRIIPRRVRPAGFARTPRPSAPEGQSVMHDRVPSPRPVGNSGGRSDLDHLRAEFRRPQEGTASN